MNETRLRKGFVAGRLSVHRDGYAFLIAEQAPDWLEGDIYVPAESARRAMHGDRVVVRVARTGGEGRAEGHIVQVLRRAHPTVVGEFHVGRHGNYVVPHDERIRQRIEVPEGLETPRGIAADRVGAVPQIAAAPEDLDGAVVDVELLEYPDEGGGRAVGRVIEVLGRPGDFGLDVEIIIRKHHLPHRFPADALDQARRLTAEIPAAEVARRRDFRGLDLVTIDGETARDFDDAVWAERLPNGHWALQVHIADVGHYVRPGSPIDREARLRGTSAYFPDRAVPMLPVELSTDICSLKPDEDRLVLSALLEIDARGDTVAQEFTHGIIRSAERMTYTDVHRVLEGDAWARQRYGRLVPGFETMRELALLLNRRRVRRGSIDFDLPEPLIEFDEWGRMTGIARSPRNIAHRIIEEFMLAANEAVAAHLEHAAAGAIYRIHERPEPAKVMEFEQLAARFGYSLGIGSLPVKRFPVVDRKRDGRKIRKDLILADERLAVSSRHYQKLAAKIEGKPEERILSYLMLRSLRQARYSTENCGHFALAAPVYTHFTSPIRRYPDLMVHRVLKSLLAGAGAGGYELPVLRLIAEECSESERRAEEAERELVEWKKADYMVTRLGDEFQGLIVTTSKFGFFVELEELFVEGFVPVETLRGDRYTYHENSRKLVGERSRRQFAIGDRVPVRLDRVDAVERKLQFSLV